MRNKIGGALVALGTAILGLQATGCSTAAADESGVGGGSVSSEGTLSSAPKIGEFDSVENRTSIDVVYVQGSAPSAKLVGAPADLKQIVLRPQGKSLIVDCVHNAHIHGPVTVYLTSHGLKAFSLSGSGKANLQKLKGDQLAVDLSGSGDIQGAGSTHHLNVSVSGSGRLSLNDLSSSETAISLSGSGNIQTGSSKSASVSIGGSGNVKVGTTETLSVDISGSGNVRYEGHPQVSQVINGSGSVSAG